MIGSTNGTQDLAVVEALDALAGRECIVCAKAIAPGSVSCCGVATCPWCLRPYLDSCRHLIRVEMGYGMPQSVCGYVPASPPGVERLGSGGVGWSEREMRAALESAYEPATRLQGLGLVREAQPWQIWQALCDAVGDVRQHRFGHGGHLARPPQLGWQYGIACFHPERDRFVTRAGAVMDQWHRGIDRLAQTRPAAAQMVLAWFETSQASTQMTFSPDGAWLLVVVGASATLVRTQDGGIAEQTSLEGAIGGAVFADDSGSILLFGTLGKSRQARWDLGAREVRPVSGEGIWGTIPTNSPAAGFLQDGSLLVVADRHDVALEQVDVGASTQIRHRHPIERIAFSPVGGHFATEAAGRIYLWQVSQWGGQHS